MKFPVAKLLATVVCSVSLLGAAAAPVEACFFNWLFGCCGSSCSPCGSSCGPCTAYYGPVSAGGCSSGTCGTGSCSTGACSTGGCSTGSCGTTAYYSPFGWGSPSCGECSTCNVGCAPCGAPGGSCASGDCGVDTRWDSKGATTTPKKTFDDTKQNSEADGDSIRVKPENGLNGDTSLRLRVPARRNASGIEQTGAEDSNLQKAIPVIPKNSTKIPSLPVPTEDGETGSGHGPVLHLDDKVASRAAPERRRIALPPNVANARLIRVPAYPKSEWAPAEPEAKVAKK